MTPSARVQAAIDILDRIIVSARDNGPAADAIVADWIRGHRYAGSKDKRAIRDHVYAAIRAFGEVPENGRVAMVSLLDGDEALFDGSNYGPAEVSPDEPRTARSLVPEWLGKLIPAEEHAALLERAPMDLRVNSLKANREDVRAQFATSEPLAGLANGLRLAEHPPIEQHPAWTGGEVEIQDAGSQWIIEACAAKPGMTVLDLCAGAGGKTLALAAAMKGEGRLIAADTNRDRLSKLSPRAGRAGAVIENRLLDAGREREGLNDLEGACDLVLIDAPCSGTGTWRRNPEGRWRLTPARLERLIALQARILDLGARYASPGGTMVYAVCSLIEDEGSGQAARYLAGHQGWRADTLDLPVGKADGVGIRLTPRADATDGFFFARLARDC